MKMEKSLQEKTGHSLEYWKEVLKKTDLEKHGQLIGYLKNDHGFTHGFANFVAHKYRGSDAGSHDASDLVDAQYSKGKENLKTVYTRLIAEISEFGNDLEIAPKKANVSMRRKKQFALIQPSTRTRIDVGLKLKGKPVTDRLETSGPFGSMCTHRVRLETEAEVDTELLGWLREAYDAAG